MPIIPIEVLNTLAGGLLAGIVAGLIVEISKDYAGNNKIMKYVLIGAIFFIPLMLWWIMSR